jgi:CAAX prenyl protease-like protein
MIAEPALESILPAAFDPRWLYGIRVLLVVMVLAVLWRYYDELKDAPPAGAANWGLGVGVGILVFLLWISLDFRPLAFGRGEGFDPTNDGRISVMIAAVRLAGAALVVPVMEELFWRSFILRFLQHPSFLKVDPGTVGWTAVLLSSGVFASEHRLWFAGFLAGLAYAWLYRRSGNLWVPIISHAVTNLLLGVFVLATGAWWLW